MIQTYKNQTNQSLTQASNSETELDSENLDHFTPKKHSPKIYQKILKKALTLKIIEWNFLDPNIKLKKNLDFSAFIIKPKS